ncbi:PREDICTED: uncharacterized protein LOC109478376 [Branchiostoma belcheri]|uniref:Uncharacterized protein LOC109478376 n=1 Tax=Branchiostoma belcheri TaxID=7741 RepID=A0A6P4ZWX1_BRABE|nr:PREDICTED: uncharacterized protein LOC109478376 [Branchiostoma belcheri]XP_019635463.1 PREDICTED: uncharacterized protein LOC109478376 [Branchiostoma belcheri]
MLGFLPRIAVLVALLAAASVDASHFRGGTISCTPDMVDTGLVHCNYRLAWRRPSADKCDQDAIDNNELMSGEGSWNTPNGMIPASYHCTDFSVQEDWQQGVNTMTVNATTGSATIVSFDSCCWITVQRPGGGTHEPNWQVRTQFDIGVRADTGRPNSSPITASSAIHRIQINCDAVIRIPTKDSDGDAVKCYYSSVFNECGDACDPLPLSSLDEDTCEISYSTPQGLNVPELTPGWYAIALTLEDYPPGAPRTAGSGLSRVPLQFLVNAYTSNTPCSLKPQLIGQTPQARDRVVIPAGGTYHAVIEAEAQSPGASIVEITTVSPRGMIKSDLVTDPIMPHRAYVNITWSPTQAQLGQHIFCFQAQDSNMADSDQRCMTLVYMGTQDVDECQNNNGNCSHACVNTVGSYHCACPAGMFLRLENNKECDDIDECARDPGICHANATCINTLGSYICECDQGYFGNGSMCIIDIDDCANGTHGCHEHAHCVDLPGSHDCICDAGFVGDGETCTDVNECAEGVHMCPTNASCTNTPGSYTCKCDPGHEWDGTACSDVNECAEGVHMCPTNASCTNTPGSYTCKCDPGHEWDGTACSDVNECAEGVHMCPTNASCTNTPGSYTCKCDPGHVWDGTACSDFDECSVDNGKCEDVCINTVGGHQCECSNSVLVLAEDGLGCTLVGAETTCTNEGMILALPEEQLTLVNTNDLHWDPDQNCRAVFNGTHHLLRTGLYQCGTRVTFDPTYVIFTNLIRLIDIHNATGVISRDDDSVIYSKCKYEREEDVSAQFMPIPGGLEFTEVGFGTLSIRLDMFHSQHYLQPYTVNEYPVHKSLRDNMYFQLQVEGHSQHLSILALSCKATMSPNKNDALQYALIDGGCAVDETLQFYSSYNLTTQQFGFEAFRFIRELRAVYIHCEVEVCGAAEPGSRCAQGCAPGARRKRALSDMTGRHTIYQGPIVLDETESESKVGSLSTGALAAAVNVGLLVTLIALAAVLVATRVRRSRNKHAAEYQPVQTDCDG